MATVPAMSDWVDCRDICQVQFQPGGLLARAASHEEKKKEARWKVAGRPQAGAVLYADGMEKITLLRVIPTMTFIHFLTGKSSGILSDISSDILFGILSSISSGILSSGILSGKSSGILSGISSGILSDISSGILSGISFWHIF